MAAKWAVTILSFNKAPWATIAVSQSLVFIVSLGNVKYYFFWSKHKLKNLSLLKSMMTTKIVVFKTIH